MGGYVVVGPLAIVRDAEGKQTYCYFGAPVPDGTPAAEVQRLVATGLVAEAADAELVSEPVEVAGAAGDPAGPSGSSGDGSPGGGAGGDSPAGGSAGEVPARSAAKPVWVDFAVARGKDRDVAEAMTKDQLVEEFGSDG